MLRAARPPGLEFMELGFCFFWKLHLLGHHLQLTCISSQHRRHGGLVCLKKPKPGTTASPVLIRYTHPQPLLMVSGSPQGLHSSCEEQSRNFTLCRSDIGGISESTWAPLFDRTEVEFLKREEASN